MFVPNHLHLLVKGYMKTPPKTEKILNIFFTQLVNTVGMKVVAGPTSVYVNEPGNEGITGTVTLATSHGSIHVWDNTNPAMFQFDLYSCCEFKPKVVLEELDSWAQSGASSGGESCEQMPYTHRELLGYTLHI